MSRSVAGNQAIHSSHLAAGRVTVKLVTEEAANVLNAFIRINRTSKLHAAKLHAGTDSTANESKLHNNSDLNGNKQHCVKGQNHDTNAYSSDFDVVDTGAYVVNRHKPNDNLGATPLSPGASTGGGGGDVPVSSERKKHKWAPWKRSTKSSSDSKTTKTPDKVVSGSSSALPKPSSNNSAATAILPPASTPSTSIYVPPKSRAVRASKTAIIQVVPLDKIPPKIDNTQFGAVDGIVKFSSPLHAKYQLQGPTLQSAGVRADGPSIQSKLHSTGRILHVESIREPRLVRAPIARFDEFDDEGTSYDTCDSPNMPKPPALVHMLSNDVSTDGHDGKDEADQGGQNKSVDEKENWARIAADLKRIGDKKNEMGTVERSISTTLSSSIFSCLTNNKLNYEYFRDLVSRAVQKQPLGTQFLILCTMTADVVERASKVAIEVDEVMEGLTVDYIAENMSPQIASSGGLENVLNSTGNV